MSEWFLLTLLPESSPTVTMCGPSILLALQSVAELAESGEVDMDTIEWSKLVRATGIFTFTILVMVLILGSVGMYLDKRGVDVQKGWPLRGHCVLFAMCFGVWFWCLTLIQEAQRSPDADTNMSTQMAYLLFMTPSTIIGVSFAVMVHIYSKRKERRLQNG